MAATLTDVTIDRRDMFVMRNDGDTELVKEVPGSNGARHYRIGPGKSALVDFELIRVWWGDPRSRKGANVKFSDSEGKGYVAERTAEVTRLGILYGCYSGPSVEYLNATEWTQDRDDGKNKKAFPHPVTIHTQTGEEIIPPAFDESGDLTYGAVQLEEPDLTDPVALRDHQAAEMSALRNRLAELEGRMASDVEMDTAGTKA